MNERVDRDQGGLWAVSCGVYKLQIPHCRSHEADGPSLRASCRLHTAVIILGSNVCMAASGAGFFMFSCFSPARQPPRSGSADNHAHQAEALAYDYNPRVPRDRVAGPLIHKFDTAPKATGMLSLETRREMIRIHVYNKTLAMCHTRGQTVPRNE